TGTIGGKCETWSPRSAYRRIVHSGQHGSGSGSALEELRVGDLTTFLAVRAAGSVSQAARATGVTPSQVSKAIARLEGALRVRVIELPPALVRAYAAENIFDLGLLPGASARLPAAWQAVEVGSIRKALFAPRSIAKALGPPPVAPQRLRGVPFIAPVYHAD